MSEPYWETLNTELINSVSLFEPAHVGIYAHSPGFCDSREQYDEITVSMIRDFKVKWRKNLHECPCCGQRSIIIRGAGEQCDVCGWYDDPFAEEFPDKPGEDILPLSLNEARQKWTESKKPIVEITEIPIGGPPDWKDVLWSAGILEQTLRSDPLNSKLFSEDRIQEILSEYSEE